MTTLFLSSLQKDVIEAIKTVKADERTLSWPMLDFKLMALACISYVLIVVLGKEIMKKFEKFDLFWLRVVHNGLLTLANFYFVVEIVHQAYLTSWFGSIDKTAKGFGMACVFYWYYLSKYWEFMDTFIMVLRKSNNQISFLHVYHHVSVTSIWWFNMVYYPGGEAAPAAFLNSFVHVWMYGYYFLATLNIQVSWKKYLTQLQISQLGFFVVHGIWIWMYCDPEFKVVGLINGIYALSVLVLFLNFYKKSYLEGRRLRREHQEREKEKAKLS